MSLIHQCRIRDCLRTLWIEGALPLFTTGGSSPGADPFAWILETLAVSESQTWVIGPGADDAETPPFSGLPGNTADQRSSLSGCASVSESSARDHSSSSLVRKAALPEGSR